MYFYHDSIGFIHLVSAVVSLVTGTMILVRRKGTSAHKKAGYVYVTAMTFVLITAFLIYRLWGKWGLFHYAALVSSITLFGGFIPIIIKYPKKNYIAFHFSFMYWSVLGLYGAFFAEIMTRLPEVAFEGGRPNAMFLNMTGLSVALVMGFGGFYFYKNKNRWEEQFSKS